MLSELAQHAPAGWRRCPIGDVCARITSGGTPSRANPAFYQNGRWPWVKTQELNDCWLDDTEEHITDDAIAQSSAKMLPEQTVLLALYGATVGQLGIIRRPMTCNQACCAMIADPTQASFRYLYYALLASRTQLKSLASGAAQQNLSGQLMRQYILPFPDVSTQQRIADVLGKLDDKIELNRRMNRTLEKMAAAIFKSWFINFDPVHAKADGRDPGIPAEIVDLFPDTFEDSDLGPIPKGWKVGRLGEHALNFDSKRVPVSGAERAKRRGPYPYHGAAAVMDYVDDYLFDGVFLLVGEDGSVVRTNGIAVTQYVWGKIWVNNHAHVLQGKGAVSTEQLFLYFHFEPVAPYVTGAVQPKLSQGRMNQMPFVYPGEAICGALTAMIRPLFAKLRANADQIKTLSAIRDTLLPKLMSGEIDVPDVEQVAGRAV